MVRRVAIFLCIAFTSAAVMLALLARRPGREASAGGEAAPERAPRPADAEVRVPTPMPGAPAAVAPEPAPGPAPSPPADAQTDALSAASEAAPPPEPLFDVDPREARLLQRYGGHSHSELIAAEEALGREVGLEREAQLRQRMANGNWIAVHMGESAPALPTGPDGSEPVTATTTVTDAAGNTELRIAWLPHGEYPEFYERYAELVWLQAQLRRGDE